MIEKSQGEAADRTRDLTDPESGRSYLKEALNQNDEQVFLVALDNIIKSFLNFDDELKSDY